MPKIHIKFKNRGIVLDNLKQSEDWYGLFQMGAIPKARTKFCWRSTGVNPMDILNRSMY
jgi:hypothetical protein